MRWLLFAVSAGAAIAQTPNGAEIYRRVCSSCHEQSNIARMPQRDVIAEMSAEKVLAALTGGAMQTQASSLSIAERRAVSEYVTGKTLGAETSKNASCKMSPGDLKDPLFGSVWNG
jgi:polyvinyl alcohol dehydrogenase (cytochrome)